MRITPILALLSRRAPAGRQQEETTLAGVSFAQQEPDLAKEVGLSAREVAGWAMGASGALD